MRFRFLRSFGLVALPSLLAACGEDTPVYPPIVIVVGNAGGSGNVGTGNTGNNGNSAGSRTTGGSGSNGGSSNAGNSSGGSGNADPLYAHCAPFANAPAPAVKTKCDMDALEDGGELKGDVTADKTLKSGHSYVLKGTVRVMPGKKLTVEPCVKVIGEDSNAVLVTLASTLGNSNKGCSYASGTISGPPGQLIAVGEPMAPIIFTSAQPVGKRAPGQWGGVLLLGNAQNSVAEEGQQVPVEGLPHAECHGYHTNEFNDESSGHLEYVRIEYASRQVAADSETNGLTFASVGSGTEVHYVMVSNSADDCFEWFGGVVNADHLIALNCDDDSFDTDTGFSGKLQFLFGRQFTNTDEVASYGLEIDRKGVQDSFQTKVGFANVTLCGGGVTDMKGDRSAIAIGFWAPAGADPTITDLLATGFAGPALLMPGGTPHYSYSTVFAQPNLGSTEATGPFLSAPGDDTADLDRFCDCWANPPAPVAATTPMGAAPAGFPDAKSAYRGAFADASPESNWMTGLWVDWNFK